MTASNWVLIAQNGWHMDGWGWGMGLLAFFGMLLVVALVAGAIVAATQGTGRRATGRRAIDVLDERYARGEIDRNDYLERRGDLEQRQ